MKRRNTLLRSVVCCLVVMAIILSAPPVSAYKPEVHQYIAGEALELYSDDGLGEYWAHIEHGAGHEDEHDHVYSYLPAFLCIPHFWDADKGRDDPVEMFGVVAPNSWQKAQVLWGMALGEYASGDLTTAYERLGHVAHLLADQSVPAHAHEDAHLPTDDDCYEDWMESNATLNAGEKADLDDLGPVAIPDWADPLFYLFYTTNQIGDFFASDNADGDTIDNESPAVMSALYTQLEMDAITSPRTAWDLVDNDIGDNNSDGDLSRIREHSFKYAIRATAALYEHFSTTAGTGHLLTVVIDHVKALDSHDPLGGKPDFFVNVTIDGFRFKNRGDRQQDENDIDPGWAFAREVGTTGTASVELELWDDDVDSDDHSDINPVGSRRQLYFTVNLETREISGEVVGEVGQTLTAAGTESKRSQIWFRVLLPIRRVFLPVLLRVTS